MSDEPINPQDDNINPEYLDPDELTRSASQASWPEMRRRQQSTDGAPPTLVQQMLIWNARLRWSQTDLANAMDPPMDTSQLAKIFRGENQTPHTNTLARIADAYQRAGITDATIELLAECRDYPRERGQSRLSVPDHWKRLIMKIRARGEVYDDVMFRSFAGLEADMSKLLDDNAGTGRPDRPE